MKFKYLIPIMSLVLFSCSSDDDNDIENDGVEVFTITLTKTTLSFSDDIGQADLVFTGQ